jgi:predicted DNA-binding ribbon-helix-helix protein
MKVRTIKDVDERTWRIFKESATRKNMKMGILLRHLANDYERNELKSFSSFVPKIPILSEAEARELENTTKAIRKEHGFR